MAYSSDRRFPMPKSVRPARELLPPGRYEGVLVSLVDIGTQPSDRYAPRHKVILGFELQKRGQVLRDDEGRPLVRSVTRTLSLFQRSKLAPDVESLLGRGLTEEEADGDFDLAEILGKAASIHCRHKPRGDGQGQYAELSLSALDEGDVVSDPESDLTLYLLDPDGPLPTGLPDWMIERIKDSAEWRETRFGPRQPAPRPEGRSMAAGGPAPATRKPVEYAEADPAAGVSTMDAAMAAAEAARQRFGSKAGTTAAQREAAPAGDQAAAMF